MRWLGIWLDKKLTFNHHVDEWTQKACRVINHLRAMNNTVRGMAALGVLLQQIPKLVICSAQVGK